MKVYIMILGIVLCGIVTQAQDLTYTVHGTVRGMQTGWVNISYFPDGEHLHEDSAKIVNGSFTFHGPLPEPTRAILRIQHGDGGIATFYLDHSPIEISFNKDSVTDAIISGSRTQTAYDCFRQLLQPLKAEERRVYYTQSTQLAELRERRWKTITNYFNENPNSFAVLHELLETYAAEMTATQFEQIDTLMGDTLRHSFVGKTFEQAVIAAKNTDIGHTAPVITMDDVNKHSWTSASFPGKYLLIDFWASWCPPCRELNHDVVKVYQQYKNKGLAVVGFSLDYDKTAWLKAIAKDSLPYTQLSDLQCWNSPVRKAYGLYALPKNFLLDAKGTIVAKDLYGKDLEKKLAELMP